MTEIFKGKLRFAKVSDCAYAGGRGLSPNIAESEEKLIRKAAENIVEIARGVVVESADARRIASEDKAHLESRWNGDSLAGPGNRRFCRISFHCFCPALATGAAASLLYNPSAHRKIARH